MIFLRLRSDEKHALQRPPCLLAAPLHSITTSTFFCFSVLIDNLLVFLAFVVLFIVYQQL